MRLILAALLAFLGLASAPACAQFNGCPPGWCNIASASAPSVLTYRGTALFSGASINIGTATSDRLVVVCVEHIRSSAPGRAINSITIGGNAATINVQLGSNATSGAGAGIGSLIVTSGTSATIVWALNAAATDLQADVYTITGLSNNASPFATTTGNGSGASSTINTGTGGALIACASSGAAPATTFIWAGVTSDEQTAGGQGRMSSASQGNTSAATGATISSTAGAQNVALAAASWK